MLSCVARFFVNGTRTVRKAIELSNGSCAPIFFLPIALIIMKLLRLSLMPTSTPAPTAETREKPKRKVIVAIHGIGDQYRNATIQSVIASFGQFADYTAAMPLGRLGAGDGKNIFFLKGPPAPVGDLATVGFVEFYWADIPRKVQTAGYRIEETKAWARTVVERLRARYNFLRNEARARSGETGVPLELGPEDFSAAADAIDEMIETFAVLDHLLLVFEKLGLLKFNLNDLLTSYVGDVQIVADFPDQRRIILDEFSKLLNDVAAKEPEAEIYLIAHSEGTVVAFMGLLEAMASRPPKNGRPPAKPPSWIRQVHGLMTIGSPIDKHLILWPDIWDDLQTQYGCLGYLPDRKQIKWRNYYDYGDPVGFRLDTTRDWLRDHKWAPFFEFESSDDKLKAKNEPQQPNHDYGFSRYLFPGAAHIDYWGDEDVFGHFIENVVLAKKKQPGQTEPPSEKQGSKPAGAKRYSEPPRDKPLQRIGSLIIPYAVIYLLIFAGVYLLYKGTVEYLFPLNRVPPPDPEIRHFAWNVAGISGLMMGMIALARIPRLTRRWTMSLLAIGAFVAGSALYAELVKPAVKLWHAMHWFHASWKAGAFVIGVAFFVVSVSTWASRRKLWKWPWLRPILGGTRSLMFLAAFCVFVPVAFHVITDKTDANHQPPLWPLLLASAAFLYLWWLAILVFDLVFVWHRYIRSAVSQTYLRELRRNAKGQMKDGSPIGRTAPSEATGGTAASF
jgi:hypothetical protein